MKSTLLIIAFLTICSFQLLAQYTYELSAEIKQGLPLLRDARIEHLDPTTYSHAKLDLSEELRFVFIFCHKVGLNSQYSVFYKDKNYKWESINLGTDLHYSHLQIDTYFGEFILYFDVVPKKNKVSYSFSAPKKYKIETGFALEIFTLQSQAMGQLPTMNPDYNTETVLQLISAYFLMEFPLGKDYCFEFKPGVVFFTNEIEAFPLDIGAFLKYNITDNWFGKIGFNGWAINDVSHQGISLEDGIYTNVGLVLGFKVKKIALVASFFKSLKEKYGSVHATFGDWGPGTYGRNIERKVYSILKLGVEISF